jgi:hypothetical protein
MHQYRSISVRDCQGALWALYQEFDGQAQASFEGDLSALHLYDIPGSSNQETSALKRQTTEPELDFCIVPITVEITVMLKARLSKPGVLGRNGSVIHTQLAVEEELVFSACDNFHDECTVVSPSVSEELLISMKANGVLRSK